MDPDLAVAAVAAQQHSAFSRAQAYSVGFTPPMVRNRLHTGRWGQLFPHAFRLAGSPPTWEQRLWGAWLAAGEGAVVSHLASARLHGLVDRDPMVELSIPRHRRIELPGVIVHRSRFERVDIQDRGGLLIATPTLTLIQLSAVLDADAIGPMFDRALNRHMTTPPYLDRRLRVLGRNGRPGVTVLDQLLAERPSGQRRPDPGLEPRLLELLATLGGPPPVSQYHVRLPSGRDAFLDVAWPDDLLALEADSYLWHSGRIPWSLDQTRRNELTAMGWRIMPVTAYDLDERPDWLLDLVKTARRGQVWSESAS